MKPPPWIRPCKGPLTGLRVTMIDRNKGEITINDVLIVPVGVGNCLLFEVGMEVEFMSPSKTSITTPFVKP